MTSTADLLEVAKPEEKPKTFKTMTMSERLNYIRAVITVEPIIAAYVMAASICGPALLYLEFEKSCRSNFDLPDPVCEAILGSDDHNFTKENDEIQVLISDMHSWQLPVQSVMPLILVLFLGSYSDRHKLRKPFLLIPIFGEFFAVAGCILCVIFMKQWPLQVQGVVQTVVPSFFGGQTMVVMAVYAYIADVSTMEMRTLRIGVVQIVLNICLPISQALSGVLYDKLGYIGVLAIAAALYLFAVIYGIFCIKEPKKPDIISTKSFIIDAFDPTHAIDTFSLLLKKGPGKNRTYVLAVLIILFIYSLVVSGESSVFYSYAFYIFSWGPFEYANFLTVNTLVHLVGTLIGVPLFATYLKMGDLMILSLTFIDKIATNIIFGLASTVTLLYVAAVVSLITGITPIAIRSLATKIVSPDDLGKAQSLFGICESIGPAVAAPVFNKLIYVNTLETLPSAFFYVGAIFYGLAIFVILWMYFNYKAQEVQDIELNMPSSSNGTKVVETTHI